ncbi:MAG: CsgG/HfaB family protein [Verrucomicrobiae bacterium]|nr:CsgG/HfaB family protein [Verrucomicrobiae bacterium]
MKKLPLLAVFSGVLFMAGCADGPNVRYVDPSAKGAVAGTGIESQDLIAVTDAMARSILGTPQIANAAKPPTIVLLPVENTTRFPIDPDLFLTRIRGLLSEKCAGKVIFVARDRVEAVKREKELKAEGKVSSSEPSKQLTGADFFLTGSLKGLSQSSSQGQSDYVLYSFRLIDANTDNQIWESFREIKKEGFDSAVYR